ncbi:MAG: 3-isopropylmalate dehydratase small subunit [Magnetococcales bacterium]|nr:3-isopropylmalate dehydratase small subunit [Magnetococcales bacterium]
MRIQEKTWVFGDDIDTDQIIPTQYLTLPTIKEMAAYTMEPQDRAFATQYQPGQILIGGKNFGCGSSREQAPAVLAELGVKIILARSFARIFFRNAINLGILLIEIQTLPEVHTGDVLTIDTDRSTVDIGGTTHTFVPISGFLKNIIECGGLVNYLRQE